MTQNMSDHLRKISSRNGRYWLRDQCSDAGAQSNGEDELPFQSQAGSRNVRAAVTQGHESVVVSIPNVASPPVQPTNPVAAAATTIAAPQMMKHHLPPAAISPPAPMTAPAVATVAAPVALQYLPVTAPVEPATEVRPVDVPDVHKILDIENHPEIENRDEAVEAAQLNQTSQTKDSIAKIADEIVKQFPIASPSVIMFAGTQATLHADESCARVAAELAGRNLGRVLLVDSDFSGRRLTKASGMSAQGGLSEVMNIAYPWQDAILKSGSSKLDFMPTGNCPHKRWIPKESLREAVAEIKNEYQFVCVSVGDAHDSASSTWSEIADGTLLLVSATHSSDSIAESAVAQLRSEGARLIGCVVADVDADLGK